MDQLKASSFGGVAVLALFGLLRFNGEAATGTEPVNALNTAIAGRDLAGGLPDPNDNPVRALCTHFGMPYSPPGSDCIDRARDKRTLPIIVTVPDPDEGYLALYFDRWVESIQRAISDSGFAFDRQWLPWRPDPSSPETSEILRLALEAQRKNVQSQPGLLLFRREGKAPPDDCVQTPEPGLVAVLLVSETMTGGIRISQFETAQKYAAGLCSNCPVRILGPSFSGSFPSLQQALAATSSPSVRVVSGSATNGEAASALKTARPSISFAATVHSDSVAIDAFRTHIRETWNFPGHIAVITEDGTRYGAEFAAKWRGTSDKEMILSLRFPQEISRLRNITDPEAPPTPAPNSLTLPREFLPFDMRTDRPRRDAVPHFARKQTPTSQEAGLMSLASALRREKIKLAVVAATDILDTLFVTRFLRITAPDTRIVLFDSDLLLARAAETMPLQGIIAVTTYPLFLRNQYRTDEHRRGVPPRRVLFASRYAQGVYNACRALLLGIGAPGARREVSRKGDNEEDELLEYTSPFGRKGDPIAPALWMTVAGRNGFWPVEVLNVSADGHLLDVGRKYLNNQAGLLPETPSRAIFVQIAVLTALGALFVAALVRAQTAKHPELWCAFAALPEQPARGRPARAFFLAALALALAAFLTCLAWPVWAFSLRTVTGATIKATAMASALTVVVLLSIFGFGAWALLTDQHRRGTIKREYVGLLLLVLTPMAAFAVLAAWVLSDRRPFDFVLYRSLNMTSGVSPTLPLVLLWSIVAFACWVHLRRIIFSNEVDPLLPRLGEYALCPSVADLRQALGEIIQRPLFDIRETAATAFVLVLLVCVSAALQPLQTFERNAYNWLVTTLASAVFSVIVLAWFRVLYIWRTLRTLLEQIERHPIRYAFSRLPRHDAWSPLSQPGVARRTHNVLVRSLDTLRALRNVLDKDARLGRTVDLAIRKATPRIQAILAAFGNRTRETWADGHTLNRTYTATAEVLCRSLRDHWVEGTSQTLEYAQTRTEKPVYTKEQLDKQRPVLLAEEFIALRVVAWIRYVLRQIRNLMQFIAVAFVLFVLALHSYPFQSERLIDHITVGMFLVLGSGIITVLAQLDRDALLSRITDSAAGKLQSSFYLRLFSYGAIPALTVIASQFPSVGRFLFSAVRPALEALR